MKIKYIILFSIIIALIWVLVDDAIKKSEAKKVTSKLSSSTASDTSAITTSNVAEVKRYYINNQTDTIPSGQSWVRVRNCGSNVGKIDFGGGYADLEESGSVGDTSYTDFSKQGKISPTIKLDATGTKFLVEYSK